jgi:hypothetical protein
MMDLITCEDEGLKRDTFGWMVAQIAAHAYVTEVVLQLRYTGTTSALRYSPISTLEAGGLQ